MPSAGLRVCLHRGPLCFWTHSGHGRYRLAIMTCNSRASLAVIILVARPSTRSTRCPRLKLRHSAAATGEIST